MCVEVRLTIERLCGISPAIVVSIEPSADSTLILVGQGESRRRGEGGVPKGICQPQNNCHTDTTGLSRCFFVAHVWVLDIGIRGLAEIYFESIDRFYHCRESFMPKIPAIEIWLFFHD